MDIGVRYFPEHWPRERWRAAVEAMTGEGYAERMPTATYLEGWKEQSEKRDRPEHDMNLSELEIERSEEYASRLIHSLETGEPRRFNLNVSNGDNHITNLPREACVEVPCLVDGTGIRPCSVGELPPQMAALNRTQIAVQERTVTGALENDREAIHQAIKLDPLSSAVLTLDEAHEMTEELIEANREYIPELN